MKYLGIFSIVAYRQRRHPLTGRQTSQSGFTLLELLVTISVAAILSVAAIPSFKTLIANNTIIAANNALIGDFMFARGEAVTRGIPVSVCASSDGVNCSNSTDWGTGWIVFTDDLGISGDKDGADEILHVSISISDDTTISSVGSAIRFMVDGSVDCSVSTSGCSETITFCDGRVNETGRVIDVSATGRGKGSDVTCT